MLWNPGVSKADEPQAVSAFDAELIDRPVPPSLARRYGADLTFWWAWTAAEAAAKALDIPILALLHRHTLAPFFPEVAQIPLEVAQIPLEVAQIPLEGTRLRLRHTRIGSDILACTCVVAT